METIRGLRGKPKRRGARRTDGAEACGEVERTQDHSEGSRAWREVLSGSSDLPELAEEDSWVDAVVTLIAVVIFGLGWALFELDGAESRVSDYDPDFSTLRMASIDSSIDTPDGAGYGEAIWTDWAQGNAQRNAQGNSKR